MKVSSTLAGIATRNSEKREVLLVTKRQYMKDSNTCAGNATRNLHIRDI